MKMTSAPETNEAKIAKCGEYYVLAKKLNNLFITCTAHPRLFAKYLEKDDETLIKRSEKLLPRSPITKYLLPWAELFMNNQVPLDQIYILFYSIVCHITVKLLPPEYLEKLQGDAIARNLQAEIYESEALKAGFEKLTAFFVTEYSKYFVHN